MKIPTSFYFSMAVVLFGVTGKLPVAEAATVTSINCGSAVHLSEFETCSQNWVQSHASAGAGTYTTVAFSAQNFTIVDVTMTWYYLGIGGSALLPSAVVARQANGTLAVSDADLGVTDVSLWKVVQANGKIPGMTLDPNQVPSMIDILLPEILSHAINGALLSALGTGYVYVTPIGTVITVTAADGTNAQFRRISLTGTVQWEMVPGTLKNKNGQFIDSNGNVISSAVNGQDNLPYIQVLLPSFPGIGLDNFDWTFWDPTPGGTVTVGDIIYPTCSSPVMC